MDKLWSDSGITIVLLPSGNDGDAVFEIARTWTELRLISPALWINSTHMSDPTKGLVPSQRVVVLGNSKTGTSLELEVDLFEMLANEPIETIRLVVLKTETPDTSRDATQKKLIEQLTTYLQYSAPKTQIRDSGKKSFGNLVLLNLVVAPTNFTSKDPQAIFEPTFNANIVAAAEDRSGPNAMDAFVEHGAESRRFAGFALMHLATVGALWAGLPQGSFEMLRSGVAAMADSSYVSRVYVSAILTDGLARRAATRVLQRAADPYMGVIDLTRSMPIEGTYEVDASLIEATVSQLVDQTFTFDSAVLEYKLPVDDPDSGPEYWKHWWEQLWDFAKFAGDKLIKIPYFAGIWIARRFIRMLNTIFQGGDKGSTLIKEPEERFDVLDRNIKSTYADVLKTKDAADAAIASPVTPSFVKSTPELWQKLRSMLFGILDGSNIESFGFPQKEGRVPIFHRVSTLFSDPAETIEIANPENPTETLNIGWADFEDVQRLTESLQANNSTLSVQLEEELKLIVELEDQLDSQTRRLSALKDRLEEIAPKVNLIEDATNDNQSESPTNSPQEASESTSEAASDSSPEDVIQNA